MEVTGLPRGPREFVDEGFFHIIARGNNKQEIFHKSNDYTYYLSLVDRYAVKHGVSLNAYVLMPNHVHLIIQGGTTPLGKFMQGVQQCYAQTYNKRYNRVGHVFQGRYKALLIEDEVYFIGLIRYIHLNPVRAGLCSTPEEYPWSSHHHYHSGHGPGRVATETATSILSSYGANSICDYELLPETPQPENIQSVLNKNPNPLPSGITINAGLEQLLTVVSQWTGIDPTDISGPAKTQDIARARRLYIYCATRLAGYPAAKVAETLGRSLSTITMANNFVTECRRRRNPEWMTAVEGVQRLLENGRD